jgi:hypothetical protein
MGAERISLLAQAGFEKARPGWAECGVRRAKHQTQFYASAGNPQAAQDRRCLFQTKFALLFIMPLSLMNNDGQ